MHELSIAESVVDLASEHAEGAQVKRITLEVGRLSGVMADALRFCFDLCAEGSVLEGAELEIVEPEGRGRCRACGRIREMRAFFDLCECGSGNLECIAGAELRIKEMELA